MLRSHLCLCSNTQRKTTRSVATKYPEGMYRGRRYKLLYRVITLSPMSRRPWRQLSLVDRWCQCNMCGWNGVLSVVLAGCVVVCAVRVVVSRSVFCPVGILCVGLLVGRYSPWCEIS